MNITFIVAHKNISFWEYNVQYLIAEVFIFSEAQEDHLKIKLTSMLPGESYKSLAYQFRVGKSTIG